MPPKPKAVLAVMAGLLAGFLVIFLIEMASPHHPPSELDFNDRQAVGAWVATLPGSAFAILLLGYFLGAVAAGYVANRLSAGTGYRPALVAGVGLLAAGVMNLLAIPHPIWFAVVSSLLYLVGAWLGGRVAHRS